MIKYTLSLMITFFLLVACKENPMNDSRNKSNKNVNVSSIENTFIDWWVYQHENIDLSSDFIGFNEQGEEIEKEKFFQEMSSGDHIPVKLEVDGNVDNYQLHRLGDKADKEIKVQIQRLSTAHFNNFKKIGTKFPDFDFQDIEKNLYTNDGLKGKTIVVKTWFIACKPCIKEFPELNELVKKYKYNDDIVFLSLALDPKEELKEFLSTKSFNYKVIPDQKAFIQDELKTNKFPTHIVIDKNGNYISIPDGAGKLIAFLNKSGIKDQNQTRMPPPPPPPPINKD